MTENLIVPGVNLDQIITMSGQIFSHANCIVSPIARTLKPILDLVSIDNVIVSTYQSSSGAGKKAQDELLKGSNFFLNTGKHLTSDYFPQPLPFNIIPQIGAFDEEGYATEEVKIKQELQKLLGDFPIMVTAVRVPSLIGHASSLTIQLTRAVNKDEIISSLIANNITVVEPYMTPIEIIGSNQVFVGRIRQAGNWLQLWVVSDNLMVGAAYDSFVITKALLNKSC
jgi:aspartate-semialdehyde dehydrogenase